MRKGRVIFYFVFVIGFFFYNYYFRPINGNPLIDEEYRKSKSYVNDLYRSDEYFKNALLSEEEYDMYYAVIQASLKNQSDISIPCSQNCNLFSRVVDAVILDHPELISFQIINRYYYQDGSVTYRNDTNLNRISTYLGTKRIDRELEFVRKKTKNMSDKEKIIYVYDYVASHSYDHGFTWSSGNQSAYSFFSKGTSVCAGFAKASQILFQNVGIKSYLVFDAEHMWNYVEYEGKYYVFDATYGTAEFTKESNDLFYSGLGETTTGYIVGSYEEVYPKIEATHLKDVFGL